MSKDEITAIEVAVKYLLAHTSEEKLRINAISAFEHIKQLSKQGNGIDGVVHHALRAHWVVADRERLSNALKEFPEGAKVELFICAKKEESK